VPEYKSPSWQSASVWQDDSNEQITIGISISMAEEIIINVSPHETRVAVVEQGVLQEVFVERFHTRSTVGNIYKGKVMRVLPGLQSAFVGIGHEKAAFLHVTDLTKSHETFEEENGESSTPLIQDLIHEGQELLVQVTKEPIGTKGARITTNLSLASRFLVYMPETTHVGISQRIESEEERDRLRGIVAVIHDGNDGFIVRTASEGARETDVLRDAELLRARWETVGEDARAAKAPALIYEDLPLHLRAMRDIINEQTTRIVVDDHQICEFLKGFLGDFIPDKQFCLEEVPEETNLFDAHNIEDQLQRALDRNVPLKSGGYLIIDQTEAMSTVDVNTGAFVGRKDLEETIYRTNLEAAAIIPRQLRLRGIGGIVILDFIDMIDEEHKRQVLRTLEKGQHSDRVKWNISEISDLGLVEMTRKRTHESLLKTMCETCPTCDSRGFIKSAESVCLELFREIQRKARDFQQNDCLILAAQSVIDRLIDEESACIQELSDKLEVDIRFQVETAYSQEQYDVVLLEKNRLQG